MRHQQLAANADYSQSKTATAGLFTGSCDQRALHRLEEAFSSYQPLAIVTGNGRKSLKRVIDSFVQQRASEKNTDVVRIEEPFVDALHFMRFVIQSIEFDPKNLNIKDLENIFTMFLSFQRTHNRRTVLCLENAQDFDWWTLDKMRRQVRREAKRKDGVTVVFSGSPALNMMMQEQPLQTVASLGAEPILLADCSLEESRDYVREQVEAKSDKFVGDVFEYESLTAVHELSRGVKDTIDDLCRVSVWLAVRAGETRVDSELVRKAAAKLGLAAGAPSNVPSEIGFGAVFANTTGSAADYDTNTYATAEVDWDRRLILGIDDRVIHGLDINYGNVLIGIDEDCDIRISGPQIAKHHAVVINTAEGAEISHLGGEGAAQTQLNGNPIRKHKLAHSDVIEIGKYRIEFVDRCGETDAFFIGDPMDQVTLAESTARDFPPQRSSR